MLKIYSAYSDGDKIKIDDKIYFQCGLYDTGSSGFGRVKSGNLNVSRANYELQKLKNFREYIQTVRTADGYVDDFVIRNPMTYKSLEDKYGNILKDFDEYEKYGLNEEGVLLFTTFVCLLYPNNGSVQRIFGRYSGTGMYLIMPNSSFTMKVGNDINGIYGFSEDYELLQSQSLGKRLALTKMNRRI